MFPADHLVPMARAAEAAGFDSIDGIVRDATGGLPFSSDQRVIRRDR
jgi:hypothetical protein